MKLAKEGVMETGELRTVRVRHGGYERRTAARYDAREPSSVKDEQRASVSAWLLKHHGPDERLRLLSFPDRHWTFENRLNDRPGTSFLGIQRDWATIEYGAGWMPCFGASRSRARPMTVRAATGDILGYRRHENIVLHMWAGHLLSFDNIDPAFGRDTGTLRNRGVRRVTAAWLDFTGPLTDEVVAAATGVPVVLGGQGKREWPVVTTFLAGRDGFRSHEERVACLLIAIQKAQGQSRFRYRFDRFEVHTGSSTLLSVFGSYRHLANDRYAEAPDQQESSKEGEVAA